MKILQAEVLDNGRRVGLPSYEGKAFRFRYDDASFDSADPPVSLGLPPSRVRRLLADVVGHEAAIGALLEKSFLPAALRQRYADTLASRRQRLRYPLAGAA